MRQLLTTALILVVLLVFEVRPCFAAGGFSVTKGILGTTNFCCSNVQRPLIGDFNGDGRADVSVTPSGNLAFGWPVFFSNGDGTFGGSVQPIGSNFGNYSLTPGAKALVGDFNGDGRSDLALTGVPGWTTLPVAMSNGDGTFNATNLPISLFGGYASSQGAVPLVGDYNGDGLSDIALTGASATGSTTWNFVPVAFSNGDGTFSVNNTPIPVPNGQNWNFPTMAAAAGVTKLTGDYNGDGLTDIALVSTSVFNSWTSVPIAFASYNAANNTFSFSVTNTAINQFGALAQTANATTLVGDFNGDGLTDLAVTGGSSANGFPWNTVPVAFSNGDGSFNVITTNIPLSGSGNNFPTFAISTNAKPLAGDFNGDGLADIALTGASTTGSTTWKFVPVAFSNSDGSFNVTTSPIVEFASRAATSGVIPLTGDFNADGKTDVALMGGFGGTEVVVAFSQTSSVIVVNMVPATLSGETNQDSEPFLAINPAFPNRMVGTAFTPNPGSSTTTAPIYVTQNSGFTWVLKPIVPNGGARGTGDITIVGMNDPTANRLYSGMLSGSVAFSMHELTTADFTVSTLMSSQNSRTNVDQPFMQGLRIVQGANSIDRLYVGNSNADVPTVDVTANGGSTWTPVVIDKRTNTCDDYSLPLIRPAVAPNGTVYAAFYHCTNYSGTASSSTITADVVVVRDDTWATGTTPFSALVDPGDSLAGMRVVTNATIPWNIGAALGQNRLNATLSLAVDPQNSNVVYLGWADQGANGAIQTVHVRRSINSGVTWSSTDLLTLPNATNIALAVSGNGTVGALYQQLTGAPGFQKWTTTLVQTKNAFTSLQYTVLSTTTATTPTVAQQPYLGDYIHLLAVGSEFRGVFSASNYPSLGAFPQGVIYQRQVNWWTQTLQNNGATVAVSIDPFFFRVPTLP